MKCLLSPYEDQCFSLRVGVALKIGFIILGIALFEFSSAAVDPVIFENDTQMQKRYQEVTQVLRCPKCQNQSIAGSDAPIAKDMRRKVESLMKDGLSNQEIEQFMIDRYGDFVTYDPPLRGRTYALWFAPPLFLLILGVGFIVLFRKPRQKNMLKRMSHDQAIGVIEDSSLEQEGTNDA